MTIRLLAMLLVATVSAAHAETAYRLEENRPGMRAAQVREASGIAVSGRDPNKLWIINDSGSSPSIHLAGIDGEDFGSLELAGAKNLDWEDLASFQLDGKPRLLVADIGDNNAQRPHRILYLLDEPPLPREGARLSGTTAVPREIRFQYQGGPRDCEAVAVDVAARRILLVSKRTDPPEVHELPLDPPAKPGVQTTRLIGSLSVEAPGGSMIPFRNQPTAMDISADGSRAAILTYYGVFVFHRKSGEGWAEAFSRKPVVLSPHLLPQAEALAFGGGSRSIHVLTEGPNPKLVSYRLKD